MELTSMVQPAVVAAVLAALVVFAMLVVVFRRRSAARSRTTVPDAVDEQGEDHDLVTEGGDDEAGSLDARVLRLHVRALEATLVEQDDRLHEAARSTDRLLEQARVSHRQRAQCTLLAMRDVAEDEPGRVVLNRLETALTRIGSTSCTERPLLVPEPSGSLVISFATPRVTLDPGPLPATQVEPSPPPPVAEPESEAAPVGELEALSHLFDPDIPETLHRVLPIPAPPEPAVVRRRGRRGLRRSRVS